MELTIKQALQQGVAAHKEGKLEEAERFYRTILQSQPLHPDANHNLGLLAVSVNQADAALPLFKTALEANPKIEQFWLSYIDALIKEQQFDAAKKILEQAKNQGVAGEKLNVSQVQLDSINETTNIIHVNPSQQQLDSLLEHYQSGRFSDAEKLAISITREFPKHQFGWKVLGGVLGRLGRNSEAVNANQSAVALSPHDALAHYNLGNTLKALGRLKEAEVSLRQVIALKSDFAEAHYNLGNTLQLLGRLKEAEASYIQVIALKPDFAEAHYNLGNTRQELSRLDEAEVSFTRAIALKPDFAEAYYNLGNVLQELGRLEEAEASLRQSIVLKSDFAEAYGHLGNTLKDLGRLDEAEVNYTRAIAFKPDFAEAHCNLGSMLKELGRLDEAEDVYRQAIVLKPDFVEAHFNLGNMLKELSRLDEAEVSYTRAIALKPDDSKAHTNLGITLQEMGRLEEAQASYIQAIALEPNNAEAHNNQGAVLCMIGDIDSGLEAFRKAENIDPKLDNNKFMSVVMQARKDRGKYKVRVDNLNKASASQRLTANPLLLSRVVEKELISTLYEMHSSSLASAPGPRYGNGRCSPDYNLFNNDCSVVKAVANDLTNIMKLAVKSEIFVQDSFFNIYGTEAGIGPHRHVNALDRDKNLKLATQKYSLIYYLSVGDQDCIEPGILKLYDPDEEVLPIDGMIMIFPASRLHSAAYGGKTDRVMIGVNFYSL